MLLETLHELYQELQEKYQECTHRIEHQRRLMQQERTTLDRAEDETGLALYEEEHISLKMHALRQYCNSLTAPLPVLMHKLAALSEEHVSASQKLETTRNSMKQQRDAVKNTETRVKIEERKQAQLQTEIQEVFDHMQKVREQ